MPASCGDHENQIQGISHRGHQKINRFFCTIWARGSRAWRHTLNMPVPTPDLVVPIWARPDLVPARASWAGGLMFHRLPGGSDAGQT